MRFDDVTKFVVDMWDDCAGDMHTSTPILLLGPPGIGKTSSCREIAAEMTRLKRDKNPKAAPAVCRVLDTSSMLPEDLNGLPFRDGKVTRYAPQSWLAEICDPDAYGVLVLDDLPVSTPAVQVACRQLVLERRIHEAKIADGIVIMCTGNRREDKSAASTLPSHFLNSVIILEVMPFFGNKPGEGWAAWYGSQTNCDPIVASFLHWRPGRFSMLPADKDKNGAFATPRTWHKLGRLVAVAERRGNLMEVASGLVGEGVAVEFIGFKNTRAQLVNPAEVLRDPQGKLPNPGAVLNTPDKAYAMVCGIAEVAAKGDRNHLQFLRAISWVTQSNREYVGSGVSTYINNGGEGTSRELIDCCRKNMAKDPLVKSVLDFLAKALGTSGTK